MTVQKRKTERIFKGNLVLTKDTKFDCNIKVAGNIICKGGYWNINAWNIIARDINAWNITAWDINAWDINARDIIALNINASNIDALNIDAQNINAWDINASNIDARNIIFCEKVIRKKRQKITAKMLIENRSKLEQKEWK
jgi:hypothetical protein